MVAQYLYKEFDVPFTPINKLILKKVEEMTEKNEQNEKNLDYYLKFFFFINLAQIIIERNLIQMNQQFEQMMQE